MWYVGADVHLRSSSICVLDEHGRRINQKKITGPWSKLGMRIETTGFGIRLLSAIRSM